jgi:hypothetical protein
MMIIIIMIIIMCSKVWDQVRKEPASFVTIRTVKIGPYLGVEINFDS